jgi:dipeptidyl aminopeptidase/acylaminoacyl peptidase
MIKRATVTFSELALWCVVLALLLGGCTASATDKPTTENKEKHASGSIDAIPLIPREVLFGNPQRAQARLSPDGKWLSFLAPVEGVLNVWVGPVDDLSKAVAVTEDKKRGIRSHDWAYDARHILYTQDKDGDENWHVYATNVETRETKDLTPIDGVNARIQGVSEKFPHEILVGLNDRVPQLHDIWRVNIQTGDKTLLQQNHGVAGYMVDDDFQVRFALNFTPFGGQVLLRPEGDGEQQKWVDFLEFGPEDAMTSGPAGFDKSGRTLYLEDSRDRNTAGLFAMNLDSGDVELIADDPRCDIGGVLAHPTEKNIQAVSFTYDRTEWKILDDSIKPDFEYLKTVEDGEFVVASRTLDDTQWIVAYFLDDGPAKTYRYVRSPERKAHFLFANRDDLDDYPLVKMHSPIVTSRDGLELVCYLSLPPGTDPENDGRPDKPVPMVLNVHGGPWARDGWGLNPYHQWLANRGYAVLSVNYRGSTGFGKEFINAANNEWAGKMHDDLIDAVNWAVDEKIALKDKVAIMGGSYGGYATLVGLTYTPDVFACGVDIVGPSSLVTLLQNVPEYWMPFMPVMKVRVGDVDTEEGRAALLKRSPLTLVDKIKKPLLIAQGANDPRVTQLEADQIVAAMKAKNIPVTYVLYPDEGHGFARPENRKSFNAVTEAFLAEQLGGRFEPVGKDFEGATITVPAGADQVPGLQLALPEPPAVKKQADEEAKPHPDHILEESS